MLFVWGLVMLAMYAVSWFIEVESVWATQFVGIGSGVVSIMALLPGLLLGAPASGQANRVGVFLVACVAAMSLRGLGTVALFVVCRYQMGLSLETLAIHICGWYAFLTAVEVRLLAKKSAAFDTPLVSAIATEQPIQGDQLALQPTGYVNTETVLERLSTERNQ